MAFATSGLSSAAVSKESLIWHYTSGDAALVVEGAGYFNSVAGTLPAIGLVVHYDVDVPTVNIYAFTNTGSVVTLLTGAVSVSGPGVEFT